ncbi:MAG: hypothetical protein ACOC8Y_03005 [Candidatus Natronoplasma sp.]
MIGTWDVSHETDEWPRLYEQRPPGYPEDALYTFYEENNSVKIVYNNTTYITEYEYYEEEKELRIYDDPLLRPLVVYSSFEISFSYTGERMSWEWPDLPVYLVLERVD